MSNIPAGVKEIANFFAEHNHKVHTENTLQSVVAQAIRTVPELACEMSADWTPKPDDLASIGGNVYPKAAYDGTGGWQFVPRAQVHITIKKDFTIKIGIHNGKYNQALALGNLMEKSLFEQIEPIVTKVVNEFVKELKP